MRILLLSREDLLAKAGGDTVQIQETARYLEGVGHEVTICPGLPLPSGRYDLAHLFNLTRVHETDRLLQAARARGLPVVLTPIFHDLYEYNRLGRFGLGRWLFRALGSDDYLERARTLYLAARPLTSGQEHRLAREMQRWETALAHALTGHLRWQRRVVLGADLLILVCPAEEDQIRSSLLLPGEELPPRVYIPVAMDTAHLPVSKEAFVRRHGRSGHVLTVGRVEDLKNTLTLARALEGTGLDLVVIGSANPRHRAYGQAVRRVMERHRSWAWLEALPRRELWSAYGAARVHVQPSWFETTGLSSLEAAASGCRVVITNRGYGWQILGRSAWTCDPSSPASIKEAVLQAWDSPLPPLARDIQRLYSWEALGPRLVEAYEGALDR